jgi:hypothetical protein
MHHLLRTKVGTHRLEDGGNATGCKGCDQMRVKALDLLVDHGRWKLFDHPLLQTRTVHPYLVRYRDENHTVSDRGFVNGNPARVVGQTLSCADVIFPTVPWTGDGLLVMVVKLVKTSICDARSECGKDAARADGATLVGAPVTESVKDAIHTDHSDGPAPCAN